MNNRLTELDCAKAILTTYHQVHDNQSKSAVFRKKQQYTRSQKTKEETYKELETEIQMLKEKYIRLQNELINKDERLSRVNRQLIEKNMHITRLQEDFENAIYQLTSKK